MKKSNANLSHKCKSALEILIDKIEGDFFNVMGLPLCALTRSLKEFGINVLNIKKGFKGPRGQGF